MRKLLDRYTGQRGTAHRTIAHGTIAARPGCVYFITTHGPSQFKGYALEIPTSDLKYRGTPIDQLPETRWLSDNR